MKILDIKNIYVFGFNGNNCFICQSQSWKSCSFIRDYSMLNEKIFALCKLRLKTEGRNVNKALMPDKIRHTSFENRLRVDILVSCLNQSIY